MKYLLLLNRAEDALPEPGTPAAAAMLREYTTAVQAMAEAGVLVTALRSRRRPPRPPCGCATGRRC